MSAAPALVPHLYKLVVVNGPEKGTFYQLFSSQVSIGRGEDNDIVIKDPRCSRRHVVLEITDEGVEALDVSQKGLYFNGQRRERALLVSGSVFAIGTTEIRLEMERPEVKAIEPTRVAPQPAMQPPPPPPLIRSQTTNTPKRSSTFLFVSIAIIGLLFWLFLSPSKKPKEETPIQSDEQVESTIKDFQSKQELLRKQQNTTPQYREAQILYLQGFRDYRKGQYGRAVEEFRGALSIYPDHALATRYLKLARKQLDEIVQRNMIEGRQNRDRNMFQRCVASFEVVMTTLNDPNNRTYREAKEIRDECKLHLGGQF